MNATSTIWPRSSERRTVAPAGSRSVKSGAGAMTFRCGCALTERSAWIPACASFFSCADAAQQSASVSATRTRFTARSIEQHVVRARGTGGRLREVDREDRIELHAAVGADVDQAQRVARRE